MQIFEQRLLGERTHEGVGRDLFLAFDQAQDVAVQDNRRGALGARRPDVAHTRPRMASRYSTTRTRPGTERTSSAGTPPTWMIVGVHPVLHLPRFAAHEHEQRAIGADQQQREFAGLGAGFERAAAQRRAVTADDRAEFGLRQAQLFACFDQRRGE